MTKWFCSILWADLPLEQFFWRTCLQPDATLS